MNVVFRPAQENDFDKLYQLDKLGDKKHHWQRSFFGKNQTTLAIKNNKIVGFVVYQVSDVVEVLRIATHPGFYHQGIASHLLNTLKKINLTLFLELRNSNVIAYNLYKKFGFSEVCIRKKYYSDGEDAKIMHFVQPE